MSIAHPHNLAVKLEHTGLDAHLDLLLSTHTFGYPKEDQRLWHAVAEATGLKAERTLFIDDSEAILDAAAQFGIRYCLGRVLKLKERCLLMTAKRFSMLPRNLVFVTASV